MKKIIALIFFMFIVSCGGCLSDNKKQYMVTMYSSDGKILKTWIANRVFQHSGGSWSIRLENGAWIEVSGTIISEPIRQ